ncbi:hypothetical protein [Variovorax sp. J22R115]|uniref:hypothetical protein n=1 Tax=Variovorax sp. J22R115 TaxID=3053509 RepID=UPI00257564F6|nr:hypothetical protein [Variovorax sp. J22R115]MDM0053745.1 hypothetical protein [Variovorax sp. J22R115]
MGIVNRFVDPYDAAALNESYLAHAERIAAGGSYVMSEAMARAMLERYTEAVLQARDAMADRGVPLADFPEMLNFLLKRLDAALLKRSVPPTGTGE